MEEAEKSILNVATPAVFNAAIERFCGRIIVQPDGQIVSGDASTSNIMPHPGELNEDVDQIDSLLRR